MNQCTEEVTQFSEDTAWNVTVLDDLYISGTNLADRRSDKQLVEQYRNLSANLSSMIDNMRYEIQLDLTTPYLHAGKVVKTYCKDEDSLKANFLLMAIIQNLK